MQPIDYRNATFADVQSRCAGQRQQVFNELARLGPCTTRELAARSGIDLLSIRPRITELVDLGLVALHEILSQLTKHEGVYYTLTTAEAEALFNQRWQAATKEEQLALL